MEAARTISNQTPGRYDDAYVTPEVLWGCRVPISQQEREAFARAVQACRQEAYSHYGLAPDAERTAQQEDDAGPSSRSAIFHSPGGELLHLLSRFPCQN